jgi:predicted tellurium resistance membrane protein TerC
MAIPDFTSSVVWLSLLTLTFKEIILGVDDTNFVSIISGKLSERHQQQATAIGLIPAMSPHFRTKFSEPVILHGVTERAEEIEACSMKNNK